MPKLFWALFSLLITMCSWGIIRLFTNASVELSFWFGLVAGALFLGMSLRVLRSERSSLKELIIALTLWGSWAAILYSTVFCKGHRGLYALNSMDVASHISILGEFTHKNPNVYHGFVSLYGIAGTLTHVFGIETMNALSIALYGSLGLTALFIAVAMSGATRNETVHSLSWVSLLATAPLCFLYITNTLLFYNIGEGFWAHVTSLVVLAGAWAGYTLVAQPWLRLGIIFLTLALYRFFYGLNLGDLVVASALLVGIESLRLKSTPRFLGFLTSLCLLGAGWKAYQKLIPLSEINGGIVPTPLTYSLDATTYMLGGCLGALLLLRSEKTNARAIRFLLYPFAFACVSFFAEKLYHVTGMPVRYYSYKYGLHRSVLLAFTAPGTFFFLTSYALRSWKDSKGKVIVAVVCVLTLYHGTKHLAASYVNYQSGLGLYLTQRKKIYPDQLYSDALVKTINAILAKEQKQYHGTLGTQWASILFLNAYMLHNELGMDAMKRSTDIMYYGMQYPPPGSCVFWLNKGPFYSPAPLPLYELRASMATFGADEHKRCVKRQSEIGKLFNVCYLCNGQTT